MGVCARAVLRRAVYNRHTATATATATATTYLRFHLLDIVGSGLRHQLAQLPPQPHLRVVLVEVPQLELSVDAKEVVGREPARGLHTTLLAEAFVPAAEEEGSQGW